MKNLFQIKSKLAIFFFLFFNSLDAISEEISLLCYGEFATSTNGKNITINDNQKVVLKNNRLFIPGMMLFCKKKSMLYKCEKKRLDSIWKAELDLNSKVFKYYSHNVTKNKTQNFNSICKLL
ncbi:MAG: hypothetical protein CBD16_03865 [Betaproteobacteria bacterium TMED156]|nr:MAG: hypothetical protein CBD16_03865 [Betaproteobacteria bacterium TMED156]|tara:strand:- start:1108 stop:1473 length:366 start_codon:yes stop_codon:yes gene_type:complete